MGPGNFAHGRPIDEGAPDIGAELDVDAGLVRLGQRGVRRHHALHHEGAVPDGRLHALAEVERHVHGHHVVVDGVLVDEQHLGAGPGRLDRRGHAGGAGARRPPRRRGARAGSLSGDGSAVDLGVTAPPRGRGLGDGGTAGNPSDPLAPVGGRVGEALRASADEIGEETPPMHRPAR